MLARRIRYTLIQVVIFLVIFNFGLGAVALLRANGISSCEERGGTPVTSSWFSENNWDVRCINE